MKTARFHRAALLLALAVTAGCTAPSDERDVPQAPLEATSDAPPINAYFANAEELDVIANAETLRQAMASRRPKEDPDAVYREMDAAFHHRGVLLSPGMLQEFTNPAVVEIDLLRRGNNRNEREFSVKRLADGALWADGKLPAALKETTFRYKVVGRTPGGLHVLRIEEPAPEDLGIRCRLWVMRVVKKNRPEFLYKSDGKIAWSGEPTVVLRLIGEIELGDRDRRQVELSGATLHLREPGETAGVTVALPE